MIVNCIIFTYLNDYYECDFIEYLGINFFNVSVTYIFDNYDNHYYDNHYYVGYYYCSKQLHFQQKLLENKSNIISNDLNIMNYSKYIQSWIINNLKKIDK